MCFYIIKKEVISYEKCVYSMWKNSEGDNFFLFVCIYRVNIFYLYYVFNKKCLF